MFLGYCDTFEGTARNIKSFIEREIGATVLDWQSDYIEGRTIIEEIEEVARRTSGGIFLFTKDDALEAGSDMQHAHVITIPPKR
ncbi:MAG: nucleotide-binding protein [Verrucomicrobiota bacterium]|nr:nucleotide-binding protein [Verrucomicrobiota bacterium]